MAPKLEASGAAISTAVGSKDPDDHADYVSAPGNSQEYGQHQQDQWLKCQSRAKKPACADKPPVQSEDKGVHSQSDSDCIFGMSPEHGHIPEQHGFGHTQNRPTIIWDP